MAPVNLLTECETPWEGARRTCRLADSCLTRWFRQGLHGLVALPRSARCGMMIGCATSTGLPECDERVRVTATSSGGRPGQGDGDLGAAPPDHGPGAAAGQDPAAYRPLHPPA